VLLRFSRLRADARHAPQSGRPPQDADSSFLSICDKERSILSYRRPIAAQTRLQVPLASANLSGRRRSMRGLSERTRSVT
jgi:hypothetical protein